MIVFLARAFISLDSTGRFRPIYSPGSMSPGGWNYHVGVPEQLTVRGRNLEITLEGPSRECYITDPDGHVILCPAIGKSAALNVLPLVDLDTVDEELLNSLTAIEIELLQTAKAHYRPDGTVDSDFFNLEVVRQQFSDQQAVFSLSVNVQRPISKAAGSSTRRLTVAPIMDPVPTAEDFDLDDGDYGTQLADIMARVARLHMQIAENFQRSSVGAKIEEEIHSVLDSLQAIGDATAPGAPASESHQVNQLQQFAVDSEFVSNGAHPKVEYGLPGVSSPMSQGKRVFRFGTEVPFSLPLINLSAAEHSYRFEMLNSLSSDHFETDENRQLRELETLSSGTINPCGMHHVWIGAPGALLFALIHGDRRARVHIFSPLPVNALYDLLPADVWHQFVPHRHKLVDITADLVSATLSRALVRLDSVMSVHHEAGDDGPSLDSVLTRLPVSSTCCVTESRGGILRVVKAWSSLDPTLISFTIQPPGGKCDIEGLIQHYEELRVHQYSVLIENMQRSRGQMHHVHNLEEVCHLLGPYLKDPADDDDPSESVSNLKAKRSVKSAPTGRSRPATSISAPVTARGTTSGSRRLPLMPKEAAELARALHARLNHSGKHRLTRALKLFGWLDIYTS
jgi:hypothetical protein